MEMPDSGKAKRSHRERKKIHTHSSIFVPAWQMRLVDRRALHMFNRSLSRLSVRVCISIINGRRLWLTCSAFQLWRFGCAGHEWQTHPFVLTPAPLVSTQIERMAYPVTQACFTWIRCMNSSVLLSKFCFPFLVFCAINAIWFDFDLMPYSLYINFYSSRRQQKYKMKYTRLQRIEEKGNLLNHLTYRCQRNTRSITK